MPVAAHAAAPKPAPTPGIFDRLRFRNVGPAISGGRAAAVAGTDADSSLYYVGAAGGGVWKSTNGGQSFLPVFDREDVGSIGAIAIDPHDENAVWVGTGEGAPRNDVMTGDGVYLTTTGGTHWQRMLPLRHALVTKIMVDPRDSNVVVVGVLGDPFADGSDRGIYRTTDRGRTWQKTLYVDRRTGVSDVAASAKEPGVLYAGMWPYRRTGWSSDSGGTQGGLFKSADFGASWTKLSGHGLPSGETGRIGIAVASSDANRVYALIESKAGLLWRSDDGGASWTMVSDNTLIDERPFYYTHVFVDPTNENHLWALSVHTTVSFDGGKTWRIGARGVHGDNHAMWIASDAKRIIEANDGGAAFSFDDGRTWAMPHNMVISQLYHVGYDRMRPYDVCAPLQDNGVWCAPNNPLSGGAISSSNWRNMGGGDGTWALPDPADPAIIWSTSGGGNFAGEIDVLDTRTDDSRVVTPYVRDQNVVDPRDLRYRFNWETPIAFDPFDPHLAYAGANVLFATHDRGMHWRALSGDLTRNIRSHEVVSGGITLDATGAETSDTILFVEPSPARRGEIWVGTDDGYLQLTRDGGRTWQNVTPRAVRYANGTAAYGRFSSLSASPTKPGTLYASYDLHMVGDRTPHVYRTTDYGMSWTDIGQGLPPDQPVRSIREDPRNPNVLYAGLEESLWLSTNGGTTWRPFNLNLPATSVRDIEVQPDSDDLLLATHGRGIWIFDDMTPIQELARARNAAFGAYLFPVRAAVEWNEHRYYGTPADGSGPPAGAIVTYYLRSAAERLSADILDARGHSVRHFTAKELGEQAGLNRFTWNATSAPPLSWKFTPTWNQGFSSGPAVLPGAYTVALHVNGRTLRRAFSVQQDPRTHFPLAQMRNTLASERAMYDAFSRIDAALNVLSTVLHEAPLRASALSQRGDGALALTVAATASQAKLLLLSISENPINDQDNDFLTDVLRERMQTQIGTFGSFGPLTQAQIEENRAIEELAAGRLAAMHAFEGGPLRSVDDSLRAAKLPPLTALTQHPKAYNENVGGRRVNGGP